MEVVSYLTEEGFIGENFQELLYCCAGQGDFDALRIFLKYQPDQFTVYFIASFYLDILSFILN